MTIHIQHTKENQRALERVERLSRFLGVSKARAAVIILDAAPTTEYEQVAERLHDQEPVR